MFTASFYFLGLAAFILAASVCLSTGRRASQRVEVDLDSLHVALVCLSAGRPAAADATTVTGDRGPTWDEKAKWQKMKAIWMRWYGQCQEQATLKQRVMYSWARTLSLCAALCLVGVLLEAEFDQPITIRNILAGFRRPSPAAADLPTPQFHTTQSTSASGL